MTAVTETKVTDPIEDYRVAMFEELGFSHTEAEALCGATRTVYVKEHSYSVRLSHHDVRKHMDQGCTATQILRIFI